jgi:hypothetical protein
VIARTFFLFVALTSIVAAQTRLEPQSDYDKTDEYQRILRDVFGRIYGEDVTFSVLVVPSFTPEYAVGILKDDEGYKAFVIRPSVSVWQTEYDRLVAPDVTTLDSHGKEMPRETPDPAERKKRGLPDSYRDIKTTLHTRKLPRDLAERLGRVWQKSVAQSIEPTPTPKPRSGKPPGPNEAEVERVIMLDGTNYYFATRLPDHGLVIAEGAPVDKGTLVWGLGDLTEALVDYTKEELSLALLEKKLRRVE